MDVLVPREGARVSVSVPMGLYFGIQPIGLLDGELGRDSPQTERWQAGEKMSKPGRNASGPNLSLVYRPGPAPDLSPGNCEVKGVNPVPGSLP